MSKQKREKVKIDYTGVLLCLIGIYVPYYFWLYNVRKLYLKGDINKKQALKMCNLK